MNKAMILVATPICMIYGFVTVLVREIGRAFKYAWLEARRNLESAKRMWGGRR